jgi:two-component system cell cycle response regulator
MRFRDTLRAIYREARHMATSDGLTGLYSRGFLLEHLANVIADARKRKRELALAYLSISNLDRLNAEHGYIFADRIIRQVGEMMGFLVRGEDLTARYSGGTFCIILPDTSPDAAKVAIRRITSVVKSTELSPDETGTAVAADLIASVIGDDGLSSAEALVGKAKSRLG